MAGDIAFYMKFSIFSLMDYATRQVKAKVFKGKAAKDTAKALQSMLQNEPCPIQLLTDNGKEWEGDFRKEVENLNIENLKIIPHCPSMNGLIEKWNKYLKNALKGKGIEYSTINDLQLAVDNIIKVNLIL